MKEITYVIAERPTLFSQAEVCWPICREIVDMQFIMWTH